jgi:hypothetical protein
MLVVISNEEQEEHKSHAGSTSRGGAWDSIVRACGLAWSARTVMDEMSYIDLLVE